MGFCILFDGLIESCDSRSGQIKQYPAISIIPLNPTISSVALNNAHIAYIEQADYTKIMNNIASRAITNMIDFFISLPLFSKWSKTALRKIISNINLLKYKKSETIFQIGDMPRSVYVIKSGEYELFTSVTEKKQKELELGTLVGPPKERERRRILHARYSPNRKGFDNDFIIEKHTILVFYENIRMQK